MIIIQGDFDPVIPLTSIGINKQFRFQRASHLHHQKSATNLSSSSRHRFGFQNKAFDLEMFSGIEGSVKHRPVIVFISSVNNNFRIFYSRETKTEV